jgi:hypothetical protein
MGSSDSTNKPWLCSIDVGGNGGSSGEVLMVAGLSVIAVVKFCIMHV